MIKIPKKVLDRFSKDLKKFQSVAISHKTKDVSEADTVTLVKDILSNIFGYDKYEELTSEQMIRGTYCDLAVKIEGKVKYLIEVKGAAINLNNSHMQQAINYGVGHGIEWVALTNSLDWKLYRIKFSQPYEVEEVSSFNLSNINLKSEDDLNKLFLLCKEGITSDAMDVYHQHTQLVNKFVVAQIATSEPIVGAIRRELRRLFPDVKVEPEQILDILANEVLKRELMEGDKVKETQAKIKKATSKLARKTAKKNTDGTA
jgi:hypothetical protein